MIQGFRKSVFFLFVCISCFVADANHIVGGEIEFITIKPGTYQINLIQYRDDAQQLNDTIFPTVSLKVFSNKTHKSVKSIILNFQEVTDVFYTKVECQRDELKTLRVIWSRVFEWKPEDFADEEGYYIVWERCCRNADILNIVNPISAGMKYVLEIPPLYKNGQPYINSSPILNKPLSDYGCVGQLFYTSFIGTDPDGDSLSYKMATPLNTSGVFDGFPPAQPKPHIDIKWADGFSLTNTIPGTPALGISSRGLLTVKPTQPGLFVFSVIVEEWRRNLLGSAVKIGEVQRDFQMLVLDGCKPPPPPQLSVIIPGDAGFDPKVDTLKYAVGDEKCFEFFVEGIAAGEKVSFRADPVNFTEDFDVFKGKKFIVNEDNTLTTRFCVPNCPPIRGRPFLIDFIVEDDICPLPQLDTVRLAIMVEPPPNTNPTLTAVGGTYALNNGGHLSLDFVASDADNDFLDVDLIFDDPLGASERGMMFSITLNEPGRVEGNFAWDPDCVIHDFSDKQSFRVGIQANDQDTCALENARIEWLNLSVLLPPNTNPEVKTVFPSVYMANTEEPISFTVTADDLDNDLISLKMVGAGFNPADYDVSFESAFGLGSVSSEFTWTPLCEDINFLVRDEFTFYFIAEDEDECRVKNYDTLAVQINVRQPSNSDPAFDKSVRYYELEVNEPFELDLIVSDPDPTDEVTVQFHDSYRLPNSPSLAFETTTAVAGATSRLSWQPECKLLESGETSHSYNLIFLAFDNHCPVAGVDTLKLVFLIKETRAGFERFKPANVFTPNNDEWNNVFTLTGQPEETRNLPPDNCEDAFDFITIQDRSGNLVFESANRNFQWNGGDLPAGTYYYSIHYTNTKYKGFVTLLR